MLRVQTRANTVSFDSAREVAVLYTAAWLHAESNAPMPQHGACVWSHGLRSPEPWACMRGPPSPDMAMDKKQEDRAEVCRDPDARRPAPRAGIVSARSLAQGGATQGRGARVRRGLRRWAAQGGRHRRTGSAQCVGVGAGESCATGLRGGETVSHRSAAAAARSAKSDTSHPLSRHEDMLPGSAVAPCVGPLHGPSARRPPLPNPRADPLRRPLAAAFGPSPDLTPWAHFIVQLTPIGFLGISRLAREALQVRDRCFYSLRRSPTRASLR